MWGEQRGKVRRTQSLDPQTGPFLPLNHHIIWVKSLSSSEPNFHSYQVQLC